MSNPIRFETANFWWLVKLDRQDHHTTATVRGSPHAVARPVVVGQPIETGRHPEFTINAADQDDLFGQIRATIVGLDGPITKGDSASDTDD